ncbi:MAG: hypothetical protein ACLP5H_18925 [Desulfomonilaceae bacterium]
MTSHYLRMVTVAVMVSSTLPILVASATLWRKFREAPFEAFDSITMTVVALLGVATIFSSLAFLLYRRLSGKLNQLFMEQARYIDALPDRYLDGALVLAAALSLFLELAIIRWLAGVFPFFAFYKNFTLIACFSGLGLGYAMYSQRAVCLPLVLPLLVWQMLLYLYMRFGMPQDYNVFIRLFTPFTEQLHVGINTTPRHLLFFISTYFFLAVVFLMTSLTLVPVGQLCGRLMERRSKLKAYGLNLLGSLLGVGLILFTSYLWLPPVAWFALAFGLILIYQLFARALLVMGVVCSTLGVLVLSYQWSPMVHEIYSPYQLIECTKGPHGLLEICSAGLYFQTVSDLSTENANRNNDATLRDLANHYELPFLVHEKPKRVAIFGAGTGNDVAAALRMGAVQVDAIEIDPVIMDLGREYHPEKPYAKGNVKMIVNDARTYIRTTDKRYDMLIYGFLDSHGLLSQASSVRLDSFVYTVEGLAEARKLLNENGTLWLTFAITGADFGHKLYLMMQKAFDGRGPLVLGRGSTVTYVQGRDHTPAVTTKLLKELGYEDLTPVYADESLRADVPTDDWPFLYMPRRVYPWSYFPMAAIAVLLTLLANRILLRTGLRLYIDNMVYFLLGAAFLLIETKAITELGLTFGNTWHVIGIAIAGILVMAFLANSFVSRFGISRLAIPYCLLLLSLALGYYVASIGGFTPNLWGRIAAIAVLTSPILFSGLVFSSLLNRSGQVSGVMAANLLGATCGGLLEYNSMYFGFGSLYIFAMILYLLCAVVSPPFAAQSQLAQE